MEVVVSVAFSAALFMEASDVRFQLLEICENSLCSIGLNSASIFDGFNKFTNFVDTMSAKGNSSQCKELSSLALIYQNNPKDTKMKSKQTNIQMSLFEDKDFEQETDKKECLYYFEKNKSMYNLNQLFINLSNSTFRKRFHLTAKDKEYIEEKGLYTILKHAEEFINKRLAPEDIPNDGKQTPMKGHPVFIAQHATGCCCRGCLYKWHHIMPGRLLTEKEQKYIVYVIMEWIRREINFN